MATLRKSLFVLAVCVLITIHTDVNSCTRMVYKGINGTILTARSMDWKDDILTNLWIFPRGMERNGEVGPQSVKWKSKYGSVIASGYDISTTDGMNEKGLVANVLWLAESEYPTWDQKSPGLSIAVWAQYVLDNFATVAEAVSDLSGEHFTVITANVPGQERLTTLHLSLSDQSGDNAIFEYINGKLVIHHDTSYNVMTNSPIFDKQLALNEYWAEIGGTTMLPGTNRAADRFARASFYIDAIPKTDDRLTAVASVFSVIRNCSVPLGISTPGQPNISSTRWRSVADHKHLVYYFETTTMPNTFWVDFKTVDFSENAPVKMLTLGGNIYAGNAIDSFVETEAFKFQGI
ncbi:linear amide C-N hydrolase [Olivibacter sp. SDN3]|uniref:linear amide C-N hydrolase n=1 Tax=Olivibacter sp. SDN3 TaxID=2764720 RepID=UPI0016510CFE|nr:linear amide C-N hydrolase [Olivibacter sp. SDN3]QNL48197.1 linear amide C-N hydrolase [Olivibacter sp. SDN3]